MLATCPVESRLQQYLDGHADSRAAKGLEEHTDICAACHRRLSKLEFTYGKRGFALIQRHDPFLDESGCARAKRRALSLDITPESGRVQRIGALRIEFEPGEEIDDFRVLEKLGSGSFAQVYLALQKSLKRLVALKVSERQSDEAPVLSHLEHRHIVRIFDQKTTIQGAQLLYMQYVHGVSMKTVIDRLSHVDPALLSGRLLAEAIGSSLAGRTPFEQMSTTSNELDVADWATTVCRIGAKLADALHYAHDRDVVHRDIKPANILLTTDGTPLLADFNLSFGSEIDGSTPEDHFGGSPAYMSPEQVDAFVGAGRVDAVGPTSDIYSLAVVLYELATLEHPFSDVSVRADDPRDRYRAIAQKRRLEPVEFDLPASFPRGMRAALQRNLAANPRDRSRSAAELARDLSLAALPDVDRLLSPPPNSWTTKCSRNPIGALTICSLVPNLLFAGLNILFHDHISLYLDQDVHRFAKLVVNGIVFPLGLGILACYVWCVASAVKRSVGDGRDPVNDTIVQQRCLFLGTAFRNVVFILWIATGIIYPLWNDLAVPGPLTVGSYAEFFAIQAVQGLMASSITYLLVMNVALRSFFPRIIPKGPDTRLRELLVVVRTQCERHAAILGLAPPLALIILAICNRQEWGLLLTLGVVGIVGFCLAMVLLPSLRTTLDALDMALRPTDELLDRSPAHRERAEAVSRRQTVENGSAPGNTPESNGKRPLAHVGQGAIASQQD